MSNAKLENLLNLALAATDAEMQNPRFLQQAIHLPQEPGN